MAKKHFIKDGKVELSHHNSGTGESVSFIFDKKDGFIDAMSITFEYEKDDGSLFLKITHDAMTQGVDELIEWLQELRLKQKKKI